MELDETYFNIAKERIEKEAKKMNMFNRLRGREKFVEIIVG